MDMRRRAFLSVVCGAVAWPLAAAAQQSTNSKRLAIFSPAEPSADLHEHSKSKFWRAFYAELRRLGQIEGQNLKVESYGREQNTSGAEALAMEIVRSNPDVIFVVGCACRKSSPDILVVQPAENWTAKNLPSPFDGARERRILLQG